MKLYLKKLAIASFFLCLNASAQSSYDVILSGGRIIDGSGNAWYYGDVAFRGDRIARVAPVASLKEAEAKQWIDARGMVVLPGFIDIQGQSRKQLLIGDGRVISHVTQGITTEIFGEGVTNAPVNDKTLAADADEEIRKANTRFAGPHGFRDWLQAMQERGASLNFGSFVGATTIRMYGKGRAQGVPSEQELDEMRHALQRAMEDGAFGLSSALIYPPGWPLGT